MKQSKLEKHDWLDLLEQRILDTSLAEVLSDMLYLCEKYAQYQESKYYYQLGFELRYCQHRMSLLKRENDK
jgi:hypothetical protein